MKKASRFSNKMCFEEVLKAAQSGNANAQFHAGIEYIKGNRTARNFEEAEKWFDKAAAQGHAEAQFSVWYLFNTVSQYCSNPFMRIYNAVNYLVKSAVQGHLDAQLALAHLHLQLCHCEWKIKESYEEASKQYANAEKQDNIPVKFDIKAEDGNLKAVSIKNLDEGLKWYKIAAENGHAVAQNELGNIYLGEYHFLKSDENHKEGLKWLAKFAEQGSPIAQKKLADIYFYGINTEKNYPEAEKWMTKRAENDGKFNYLETFKKHSQIVRCLFQPSSDASEELSIIPSMFDIRHYKNKNFLGIVELITKEAEKGDDFAQYKLGEIYYYGHGIGNDYSQSLNWFTKASSQGNKDADKYLKQMYFYGIGVGQDYEKAYHFLQKGKQKFYDLLSLSFLFYNGLGVQKDLVKAEQLLCKFALKYNHAFSSFVDGYYTHLNYAEYRKCKSIYHDFEDMLPEFVKNKQLMGDFLHYTVMVAINDDCNLNCKRPNADFPAENKIEHKKAKDVNIDYL